MGGGLLQLVAHGAQDAYLTGNPQITFWKGMFKRHTNFAMESFRINFTGMPAWGSKQSATLGRHADLLYSTYIEVHLPHYDPTTKRTAVYNNDQFHLGYNLLKYADLEIGGQLIDRQYSEWMFLWDTLSNPTEKSLISQQMLGAGGRTVVTANQAPGGSTSLKGADITTAIDYVDFRANTNGSAAKGTASAGQVLVPGVPAGCSSGIAGQNNQGHPTIIYVPLNFFYTKNPGAALPLIALQYHEVKINVLWNDSQLVSGDYNVVPSPANPTSAAIYTDYIYLDVDERRRMAQESHEYLIEQIQYNEDKGLSAYQNRIDLTFNHPVKELVWVVQPTCYRNCKAPIPSTLTGARHTNSGGNSASGSNVNRLTPFTYDQNAVFKQHLQINGQDRFDPRFGDYFNKVQPYQHHTGLAATEYLKYDGTSIAATSTSSGTSVPTSATTSILSQPAIYCYSFALKPEEQQPSGTCNFSRIDTATLVMQMSGDVVVNASTDATWDVRVYAINYNILRIMSGMAGLAYSN